MKMSFFIWHIYYYRAFCTVTNDDFAYMATYFLILRLVLGFPPCISSFFFFSQLLGLLACFGFAFLLHFCRISFLHVQLSLCLCSLSRQDFATHCEPRWERRLHQLPALDPCLLPLVCICPSCKMYLSVKPNLFVQIGCYKQIKKILHSQKSIISLNGRRLIWHWQLHLIQFIKFLRIITKFMPNLH